MKAGIHAICRRASGLGFSLAGLAPVIAETGEAAGDALAALSAERARGGVVLVEQALYDALPPAWRRQLRREGLPIVMPFPGPAALGAGVAPEQELLEILQRAIGYRLRLR